MTLLIRLSWRRNPLSTLNGLIPLRVGAWQLHLYSLTGFLAPTELDDILGCLGPALFTATTQNLSSVSSRRLSMVYLASEMGI